MIDLPPPSDLELEWSLLAQVYGGCLSADRIDQRNLTGTQPLTLARLRAGTLTDWERAAFDLLPALSQRDIEEQLVRLRDLAERRRVLAVVTRLEDGLRDCSLELSDVRAQLLRAANA